MNATAEMAHTIRASIGQENLHILYESPKGATYREIMPICVGRTAKGNPAILGWCFLRDAPRYFLLKRLRSIDPCEYRSAPGAEMAKQLARSRRLTNFIKAYA